MVHPRGESGSDAVRLDFDRRLMLQFRGSLVTSERRTRFDRDGRRRSGRRTQWQEWSARIGRVVPAVSIWSPCRIRGCERRQAPAPRSGYVREARVASEPEALLQVLTNNTYRFKRIGLEAGPLSQWLYSVLAEAGLPVICVETRHDVEGTDQQDGP